MRTFSFSLTGARLALLMTITRLDGVVIRITSSTEAVTISSVTWAKQVGLQIGDFTERNDGTAASFTFVLGLESAGLFKPIDVDRGLFEGANIYVEICNAANPTTKDFWFSGKMLGQTGYNIAKNASFECVSALAIPRDIFIRTFQLMCDADFGGARCKIPTWVADVARLETIAVGDFRRVRFASAGTPDDYLNVYLEATAITTGITAGSAPTYSSSVSATTTDGGVTWTTRNAWVRYAKILAIADPNNFTLDRVPDARSTDNSWYNPGRIIMRSGYMKNKATRVGAWNFTTNGVTTFESLGAYIAVNDWVEIAPDCNHTISMCVDKYSNAVNHRGFPDVAGAKASTSTII